MGGPKLYMIVETNLNTWTREYVCTDLNHIETDVLVEGVEDDVGQSSVVPGSVDQQELGKEPELQ